MREMKVWVVVTRLGTRKSLPRLGHFLVRCGARLANMEIKEME